MKSLIALAVVLAALSAHAGPRDTLLAELSAWENQTGSITAFQEQRLAQRSPSVVEEPIFGPRPKKRLVAAAAAPAPPPVAAPGPASPDAPTVAPPAPTPAPLEIQPLLKLEDLLPALIADATFATNLANSNGDQFSPQCYQAIAALAQVQLDKLKALPTTLPEPHLITTFQIGRDLVKLNPLNNGLPAPLVNGCGGLAQDVKLDVLHLLTKVVGQAALGSLTGIFVP